MTCGEAREYLFAFLDNEVDAPLSIELQRHLDGCPHCAREAEIERTIRKRLSGRIEAAADDLPRFADVLRSALPRRDEARVVRGPRPTRFRLRLLRSLAATAVILLMTGVGVWVAVTRVGEANRPTHFAQLLVSDFEHFLEGRSRLQLASAEREMVADWLRKQTSLAVVLPASNNPQCKLLGGRKCRIAERPAAFAVYRMKGSPASLAVVAAAPGDLEGMQEVHHQGARHWVDHRKGYTVVMCRRDGLVYAAVARLPKEELFRLITGAVHEGD